MSSGSFWSNACEYAMGKPLQVVLGAAHSSCGLTVRPASFDDVVDDAALLFVLLIAFRVV